MTRHNSRALGLLAGLLALAAPLAQECHEPKRLARVVVLTLATFIFVGSACAVRTLSERGRRLLSVVVGAYVLLVFFLTLAKPQYAAEFVCLWPPQCYVYGLPWGVLQAYERVGSIKFNAWLLLDGCLALLSVVLYYSWAKPRKEPADVWANGRAYLIGILSSVALALLPFHVLVMLRLEMHQVHFHAPFLWARLVGMILVPVVTATSLGVWRAMLLKTSDAAPMLVVCLGMLAAACSMMMMSARWLLGLPLDGQLWATLATSVAASGGGLLLGHRIVAMCRQLSTGRIDSLDERSGSLEEPIRLRLTQSHDRTAYNYALGRTDASSSAYRKSSVGGYSLVLHPSRMPKSAAALTSRWITAWFGLPARSMLIGQLVGLSEAHIVLHLLTGVWMTK